MPHKIQRRLESNATNISTQKFPMFRQNGDHIRVFGRYQRSAIQTHHGRVILGSPPHHSPGQGNYPVPAIHAGRRCRFKRQATRDARLLPVCIHIRRSQLNLINHPFSLVILTSRAVRISRAFSSSRATMNQGSQYSAHQLLRQAARYSLVDAIGQLD